MSTSKPVIAMILPSNSATTSAGRGTAGTLSQKTKGEGEKWGGKGKQKEKGKKDHKYTIFVLHMQACAALPLSPRYYEEYVPESKAAKPTYHLEWQFGHIEYSVPKAPPGTAIESAVYVVRSIRCFKNRRQLSWL